MMRHIGLDSGVALRGLLVALLFILMATVAVYAQQITGTPGSPSATMTIKGNQLPAPDLKFGGVIKENAKDFKAVVATDHCAAQGRTQRPPHYD